MGAMRNAHKMLIGKPEGKRQLGRSRRNWEDNSRTDLREIGGKFWNGFNKDQWRALVNMEMNPRIP
jgi:hypothetical protein